MNKEINVTTNQESLIIREGQAAPIFTYNGFQYTADSTQSLIRLVKSKGSKENSVISYNESGIKAIMDDTVQDRKQDRVTYEFKKSEQFEEWEKILKGGVAFDQKSFIKFLQRREPGEIIDIETLMGAIQQFKFVTSISGDFTYDDHNNYTFAIKVGEAEGTVRIPQYMYANIEIFKESDFPQLMELELEVYRPKSEGEKPTFVLTCPKLQRYFNKAVENELIRLHEELDGYLIIAGNI